MARMQIHYKLSGLCLAAVALSCVPAPQKAYSPAEISGIESLEELMRVNASKADPLFGKREQASFTEAEFASMADTGVMVEASGNRIAERFGGQGEYDDGFVAYAKALAGHGKALADAAGSKDAAAAGKALTDMRNTCKACHGVYK
jgi:hypothetical protein